jgi:hypothetical protein
MRKNAKIFKRYKYTLNFFGYGYGNFWAFGYGLGCGYGYGDFWVFGFGFGFGFGHLPKTKLKPKRLLGYVCLH